MTISNRLGIFEFFENAGTSRWFLLATTLEYSASDKKSELHQIAESNGLGLIVGYSRHVFGCPL